MGYMTNKPVIAAVRNDIALKTALESDVDTIFLLCSDILSLEQTLANVHKAGKQLFLHIDLTEGLGKDKRGIQYAASLKFDGIISTRGNLIRYARECGLFTVQRFFIVDNHSMNTAIESVKQSGPNSIEIMPGLLPKVVAKLITQTEIPVIAGGLIETHQEAKIALLAGAAAVSTGKKELWQSALV